MCLKSDEQQLWSTPGPPPNPPRTLRTHGANRAQENSASRGLGVERGETGQQVRALRAREAE